MAVPNLLQSYDVFDDSYSLVNQTIGAWSFSGHLSLPAGTYTFSVGACSYNASFLPFNAGGNNTGTSPSEVNLLIQVFY